MSNETTQTSLAALLPDIKALSILRVAQTAGILDVLARIDTKGQPGVTADFSHWTPIASSSVATPSVAENYTTNIGTTITEVTLVPARHTLRKVVTGLAKASTPNIVNKLVESMTAAILAKLEDEVVSLASGFTQTVAGAATTLTEDHIFTAKEYLKSAGADMNNIFAIVSPKQYYGAKGLRGFTSDPDANAGFIGEQWKAKGFVSGAYGIKWYVSEEIDEDVSGGGDAAGMILCPGAIAMHSKGIINYGVEANNDVGLNSEILVAEGMWEVKELVDTFGVYMLSDVS